MLLEDQKNELARALHMHWLQRISLGEARQGVDWMLANGYTIAKDQPVIQGARTS